MMKNRLLLIIAFTFINIQGYALPYNELWQKANMFYQQKAYDSAINYYEQIAALNVKEATVYYNLGNTYYKLNRIGPAVLNYEKALKIKPDYKLAKDNLALTQSRIINRIVSAPPIFFIRWWQQITISTNATLWAVISIIIFLLALSALLINRIKKERIFPQQLTGIAIGIWIITMVFAVVAAEKSVSENCAVVMQNDAPLTDNERKTKSQIFVPEGTTVQLVETKAEYTEVRLPDGRTGWMQTTLLTKI